MQQANALQLNERAQYDASPREAVRASETAPNTGMDIARFVTVMEVSIGDVKASYGGYSENARAKEKEKRVKAVATSEKESTIDERNKNRDPKDQIVSIHKRSKAVEEEVLRDPNLGGTIDFTA